MTTTALSEIGKWKWNEHMNRDVEEALSELEREAHVRQRCYDRWMSEGRVSYVDARDRQERLLSAISQLRTYQDIVKMLPAGADPSRTVMELIEAKMVAFDPGASLPLDTAQHSAVQ